MSPSTSLPSSAYDTLIDLALREDLGTVDVEADRTATWTVASHAEAHARIIARQAGVVAGIEIARAVFARLDEGVSVCAEVADGDAVTAGQTLVRLQGRARSLLAGERTALNFLQQLSGVATLTQHYVQALTGTATRITDTRKTTPGWRHVQKWAVRLGGGVNHRMGLYDAVLIKENHAAAAGGVRAAIDAARGQTAPIYVEAENLEEVEEALAGGPDRILLDNMDTPTLRRAVALIRAANPAVEIETTGGYTLATVREAAAAGVDLVSIGALTHSAPALDLSMLFEE